MTSRTRFSQYWVLLVREPASVILAGKRGSRRHSTTSFSENVVLAEASYQMKEFLSFCSQETV